MRWHGLRLALLGLLCSFSWAPLYGVDDDPKKSALEQLLDGLKWREVGPYRGGRCAAVAGIPSDRDTFYFGSTGGGVWKTTDAGVSWSNVSDGFFGGSIGAVAVSEWDPNVIYVGGGEKTVRGNVSHGDGIWRSTDAGRSWKSCGLGDSRHVSRIRIHPRNADIAYAAVMGHLYGPNDERGIFRTLDGGATWQQIHTVGPEVGCVDLSFDPTNPRILYACFWRVKRTPWSLESGGEGSSLWKSQDAGESWDQLTANEGLPTGVWGISGVTVSPTNPDNVYAIIEAEEGGVFRSRDAGKTWVRVSKSRDLRQRAWYYSRIYADPGDEEGVYVLNVRFHYSNNGGKNFETISTPHSDNHDLWIDPADPARMIESNDGGANISFDGGKNWSRQDNQPTAQMYRVSTDNDFPYRLLGGQQDNSALRIRSRSLQGGSIGRRDWDPTAGGESGHIVSQPNAPDVVFGGSYGGYLTRYDHRNGQRRNVHIWPDNPMGWGAAELKYRFQWNFPLVFSPHDPNTLYAAAQALFRTRNGGAQWEALSPDLTRNDKQKQQSSGGPITQDNTSVEYYCTIFAVAESPAQRGVIWVGSDDGLIHVTRDGCESWQSVTPRQMPEWAQINSIDPHPSKPGTAYVAATRYKWDDFSPYLYKTADYGATWTTIIDGIATDHFTRALRVDPSREGLLYAGTERGVYVSFDDGKKWEPLQLDLPIVPITDLAVKEGDLIAATQGRGYWILDDLSPLHQLRAEHRGGANHLFSARPTPRTGARRSGNPVNAGTNPAAGVVIDYLLGEDLAEDVEVKLDICELSGELIRSFVRKPKPGIHEKEESEMDPSPLDPPKVLETKKGLNRFVWDMRYPEAEGFAKMITWNGRGSGPRAVPGRYKAKLAVGEWNAEMEFRVDMDPRCESTSDELQQQFDYLIELRDKLSEVNREISQVRFVRAQLKSLKRRVSETLEEGAAGAIENEIEGISGQITEIEEALYQTQSESPQDPLNFPIRLNDKLAGVINSVGAGDYPPTAQARRVGAQLQETINTELGKLRQVWEREIPALNEKIQQANIPRVKLKEETTESAAEE